MLDAKIINNAIQHPEAQRANRAFMLRRAQELVKVLHDRRMEGLRLFNSLPTALPFLTSRRKWQILGGSNQSAKTIHAAYKLALILLGMDPSGHSPKTNGKAMIVGFDGDHLADPIFTKLFREGAFDTIRDEITNLWRSVRPDPNNPTVLDPYDLAYKEKWRPAPPFIPERYIKNIAWENSGKGIPRRIAIRSTGWETLWRSSRGKPSRGIQIHVAYLDEEIDRTHEFFPEIAARGIRYDAVNFWAATPQSGGAELAELLLRYQDGDKDVDVFTFLIDDNPYMLPEARLAFYNSLSDEEREVRYFGQSLALGRKVYTMYKPSTIHGCEPFEMPSDWTRYVVLDPGTEHCGTLFVAVDPEERHLWIYDGFDLRNSNAGRWADEVHHQQGTIAFEAGICDTRAGRQTHGDLSWAGTYFKALRDRGVNFRRQGPLDGFFPGSDYVEARQEALINCMAIRNNGPFVGTSKLQVFRGRIPKLDKQIIKAEMNGEDKRAKFPEDVLVCLEYVAKFDPPYRETVELYTTTVDPIKESWDRKQARRKRH